MGIVLAVVFGGGIITGLLCWWGEEDSKRKREKGVEGATIWAVVLGIMLVFVLLVSNLASAHACRNLEAFYYDNAEVYQEAVRGTEDALYIELSEINSAKLLSAENWKQSTNLSDRIKEISDKYAAFNMELRLKRYWSQNPWTNWFIRQPTKDVKYLKLKLGTK